MGTPAALVAYYRVSTDRQGRSGLGLDAQRAAVEAHAAATGSPIIDAFTEVESGRRFDRPQLALAVRSARLRGATLVVAKLDRLSRDTRFLLTLCDTGVSLRFLDLPELATDTAAGRLILGVMVTLAEFESRRIGERVKAAYAAKVARTGRRFRPSNPFTPDMAALGCVAARVANRRRAVAWRGDMRPVAEAIRAEAVTLAATAAELNARGYRTRRGKRWTAATVHLLLTPSLWEE